MSSSEIECHIIRVTTLIRKVTMAVRFPCSLQFHLKNDHNVVESRMTYELRDGKCEPNEKIISDIQLPIRDSQYPQKKISLIILMASSNGKIPAGSIQLKVAQKGKISQHPNNQNLPVEKCPDKSATVDLSFKAQYIRSFRKQVSPKVASPSSHSIYERSHPVNIRERPFKTTITPQKMKNRFQKFFTEVDSPKDILVKARNFDDVSHDQKSIIEEQILLNQPDQYYQQKISRLSKQKDMYAKRVSNLKAEVQSIRREQQWRNGTSQDQIVKYRTQVDNLSQELSSLKDKYKNLQRRQKETSNQNRDFKQQIQKYKIKNITLESGLEEAKTNILQKQKQIRKLNQQVKQLKQTQQDMKINLNMQEKRIQYKQSTSKQQIAKLTQKFQQSEVQRQKATLQLNNMLTQFQNSQKKTQLQMKQKQRAFLEQKNKLIKKTQSLTINLKESKEQNEDLSNSLNELKFQYSLMNKSKQDCIVEIKQLTFKYENLQTLWKKQQIKIEQLNIQIHDLQQIKKQFNILTKKHIEITAENSKNTQLLTRANSKIQTLTRTIKQLENNLKQTIAIKDAANSKNNQLNRQVQKLKKNIETKQNQILNLQQNIVNINNKLSELKIKTDSERIQAQNNRNKNQSEIIYLIRTKDQLQSQIQQLKWRLSRTQELNSSSNMKNNSLNQNVLKLSQQLMNEQQRSTKLKQNIKQQQSKIQNLISQILGKQTKQKQLMTIIRTKSDLQFQLRKTIKQKQQQIFVLRQKEKQQSLHSKEKNQIMESTIKERQQNIDGISKQLENGKRNILELTKVREANNLKISKLTQQNQYHKSNISELKRNLNTFQIQVDNLNRKITDFLQKLTYLTKKQEQLNGKLQDKDNLLSKIKSQWQKYRTDTCAAMQQFIIDINKDSINNLNKQANKQTVKNFTRSKSGSQLQILSFPDNNLSLIQVQAYKKRQDQVNKIRQQLNRRDEEISLGQNEINRWKQLLKEREQELQAIIAEQKERYKTTITENLSEKNSLSQKLQICEQKLHQTSTQLQKANLQLSIKKQQLEGTEKRLGESLQQQDKQDQKIKILSKQILNINNTQAKYRTTNESQIITIIEQNKSQIQRHKTSIKQLEKKVTKQNITIQQLEQHIKKLQSQIADMQHNRQKLDKKIQFSEIRYQELQQQKKNLQTEIYSWQKKVKEQIVANDKTQQLLAAQKYKVTDLTIKIAKFTQDLQTAQNDKKLLQIQIDQLLSSMIQYEAQSKKIENSTKSNAQKLSQIIKQLRQKIIMLNSEIDLKNFINNQLQNNCAELKNQNLQLSKQLADRKIQVINLHEQLQNQKNQIILLSQNYENLNKQKQGIDLEYKKQKQTVESLTNQTMENSVLGQLLASKQKQYDRLREQYDNLQVKLQQNAKDSKKILSDLKKENSIKSSRQEQLKRKIRELQKQLSHKSHQLANQTQKNKDELDRERLQLIRSLDLKESQNNKLRSESEYIREQYTRQIQEVNQQSEQLTRLLTQKQQMLVMKTDQLKENEKKVKMLSIELKNCLEAWQRQKSELRIRGSTGKIEQNQNNQLSLKFMKMIDQIDNRKSQGSHKNKKSSPEMTQSLK